MNKRTEIREALWVLAMACIGLLFLVLLHLSGTIMVAYSATGSANISLTFWVLAALLLFFCASVFVLLRESEPLFRIIAMTLTGFVPAVATILLAVNLLLLGSQ